MLELQRKLLGDHVRNSAFREALRRAIKPGKTVVLDVGSGTGFLSFLAERMGAKECWLVESGDVALLAEELGILNDMKRCVYVHGHSASIPLPKADVIVSETLGNYALEEGIIDTLNEARAYLKKGGTMIPRSLRQFACPVVSSRVQRQIDVWDVGYGLNMEPARRLSLQNMFVKTLKKSDLLDGGRAAREWDAIDFTKANGNVREAAIDWRMKKPAVVHGIALWWEATLCPGVVLSTSPLAKPTHWEQIYLPLSAPVRCGGNETLRVLLRSDTSPDVRMRLEWSCTLKTGERTIREGMVMDTEAGR